MNKLREAINTGIQLIEKRKPILEVTDEVRSKIEKMADLYLKSQEAKDALVDAFTDYFEVTGKKKVQLKDDDYSLEDMDEIMAIVTEKIAKAL